MCRGLVRARVLDRSDWLGDNSRAFQLSFFLYILSPSLGALARRGYHQRRQRNDGYGWLVNTCGFAGSLRSQ